jgi:endonuclease/exonuclease/phosphatase family metal-dependent hydrolase
MQNSQIWDPKHPDTAPLRLDQTIDFILSQQVDIICLQEVEFPFKEQPHPGDERFYPILEQALGSQGYQGYFSLPGATYPHIPFGIGLAIFSRGKLFNQKHIDLPAADITFDYQGREYHAADRSLLSVDTKIGDQQVRILNTHLQAFFMVESTADQHPQQRNAIIRAVSKTREEKLPVILCGDFNCTNHDGTLEAIKQTGLRTMQNQEITWRRMPLILDHILVSPEFQIQNFEVIDTLVSDHKAVKALVSLPSTT